MENVDVIRRQDRIAAEVQCLLCGRVFGELFGLIWRDTPGQRSVAKLANLTTFRSTVPGAPVVALRGAARLRCHHCGGAGIVDEITVHVVSEDLPAGEWCPVHGERMKQVGRPPKACRCNTWRDAA